MQGTYIIKKVCLEHLIYVYNKRARTSGEGVESGTGRVCLGEQTRGRKSFRYKLYGQARDKGITHLSPNTGVGQAYGLNQKAPPRDARRRARSSGPSLLPARAGGLRAGPGRADGTTQASAPAHCRSPRPSPLAPCPVRSPARAGHGAV